MFSLWAVACSGVDPTMTPPDPEPDPLQIEDCDGDRGLRVTSATTIPLNHAHEAQVTVGLSSPAPAAVTCTLRTDPTEVHLAEATAVAGEHILRFAGLLADSDYDCVAAPVCQQSGEGASPFTLTTPSLDATLPILDTQTFDSAAGNEYILMNHSEDCNWSTQRLLVYDREGQVRWHASVDPRSGPSLEFRYHGDDTFSWGGGWGPNTFGRPRVIDVYGDEIYDSASDIDDVLESAFHHDGKRLADGRLLTLEETDVTTSTATFSGFSARRVAPEGGVDFHYDSQRAVDEGHLPEGTDDAWHANWVDIGTKNGQDVLYVSLCFLGSTVAIDVPSGAWRWSFGPGGDFALMDAAGTPLPDSEFPQCQHGLATRDDRLLVYDNGAWGRGHSRVTEYRLDESSMTATLEWTWTEPDWYETTLGSVDWLPGGRVLVGMGHAECFSSNPGDRTTVVEFLPTTGTKLWEGKFNRQTAMAYRADFADPCTLFDNAALCPTIAARVEALGAALGEAR